MKLHGLHKLSGMIDPVGRIGAIVRFVLFCDIPFNLPVKSRWPFTVSDSPFEPRVAAGHPAGVRGNFV